MVNITGNNQLKNASSEGSYLGRLNFSLKYSMARLFRGVSVLFLLDEADDSAGEGRTSSMSSFSSAVSSRIFVLDL